ncbi:MAG: WYL domain-containing protein, partial [Colwellia sp.]
PDFKLPASEIDITLAMVLHFSKRVFSNVLPEIQKNQLKDYYSIAESLFETDREAKRYKEFIEAIAWHPEGYGNRLIQDSEKIISSKQLSLLAEALYRKRKIRVEYESRYNNTVSTMDISPLGLVLRGHVIYLVAGYASRGEYQYRHLHSGRFASIVVLDEEPAVVPSQFDLKTYLEGGAFEKDNFLDIQEQTIELRIEGYLKLLFEERVTGSVIKETDKGLVVTFSEKPYPEFIWWLLSFGSQLEVLKPLDLRDKVKSEITSMNDLYS